MDIFEKKIKYVNLVYFRIAVTYCSLIGDSILSGQNDIIDYKYNLHYTYCVFTWCEAWYFKKPFAMLPSAVIIIAALAPKQSTVAVSR